MGKIMENETSSTIKKETNIIYKKNKSTKELKDRCKYFFLKVLILKTNNLMFNFKSTTVYRL